MACLETLNFLQKQAVLCDEQHLLIVAGPGTGKTHTITYRIARLAEQLTDSANILAITFTNKAAEHLASRLKIIFPQINNRVYVKTFHGFAFDILHRYSEKAGLSEGVRIVSPIEVKYFIKEACTRVGKKISYEDVLKEISKWKLFRSSGDVPEYVNEYNRLLKANGLLDFDDILIKTVTLLKNDSDLLERLRQLFPIIFVDEYQDINWLQHELLKFLIGDAGSLTAIGDPNQSIYSFRGASPHFFECFQQEFSPSKVLCLKDNYRSVANILEAASQVIASGGGFDVPAIVAAKEKLGHLVIHHAPTDKAEAEYVVHSIEKMVGGTSMFSHDSSRVDTFVDGSRGFSEIAVCFRLNSQRYVLEEAFDRAGIPYQSFGDCSLLELKGVGEMVSFLTLFLGGTVSVASALALLEFIVCGLGQQSLARLRQYWIDKRSISLEDMKLILKRDIISSKAARYLYDLIISAEAILMNIEEVIVFPNIIDRIESLPVWDRLLSRDKRLVENICKLKRAVGGFYFSSQVGDSDCKNLDSEKIIDGSFCFYRNNIHELVDFLSLQRPEDIFEFNAEKVSLLTLHASKGLEFPVVFIVGCEEGILPLHRLGEDGYLDEERRLFYVGMTRAKEELILTHAKRRFMYGRSIYNPPSRYLQDIEEELKRYEHAKKNKRKKPCQQQQTTFF